MDAGRLNWLGKSAAEGEGRESAGCVCLHACTNTAYMHGVTKMPTHLSPIPFAPSKHTHAHTIPLTPSLSLLSQDISTYKFCLAPVGGGHGKRQILVSLMGCIPVLIGDNVLQPFEPEMDWSKFSVSLPESDIPNLPEILTKIPAAEIAAKQVRHHKSYHRRNLIMACTQPRVQHLRNVCFVLERASSSYGEACFALLLIAFCLWQHLGLT